MHLEKSLLELYWTARNRSYFSGHHCAHCIQSVPVLQLSPWEALSKSFAFMCHLSLSSTVSSRHSSGKTAKGSVVVSFLFFLCFPGLTEKVCPPLTLLRAMAQEGSAPGTVEGDGEPKRQLATGAWIRDGEGGGLEVDVCVAHLSSCSSSSSRVQPGGTIFRPVGYAPSDVNFSPASARCLANYQRPDQRLTVARTVIRYGTGSQLPHLLDSFLSVSLAHCPDSHPGVAVVWRRIRLRTKPAGEIVQQSVLDCWNASLA